MMGEDFKASCTPAPSSRVVGGEDVFAVTDCGNQITLHFSEIKSARQFRAKFPTSIVSEPQQYISPQALFVGSDALQERAVFDCVRSAYDQGYNDARVAGNVARDGAPGYRGRDKMEEIGADLLSDIRRLRATPAPQMTGWQDISTAPKDGSNFIGWDGKRPFLCSLKKHYVKWPHQEGGPTFRDVWSGEYYDRITTEKPTHWMPLPALDAIPTPEICAARTRSSGSSSRAHSEIDTNDRQEQGNRDPNRQSGEGREVGGRSSLFASSLQRSERDVCREDSSKDQRVTGGGGIAPPSPQNRARGC